LKIKKYEFNVAKYSSGSEVIMLHFNKLTEICAGNSVFHHDSTVHNQVGQNIREAVAPNLFFEDMIDESIIPHPDLHGTLML
jgi:hypothetical protein